MNDTYDYMSSCGMWLRAHNAKHYDFVSFFRQARV